MKNLLQKLKCFLGWHRWKLVKKDAIKYRAFFAIDKVKEYEMPAYSYFKCEACGRVEG